MAKTVTAAVNKRAPAPDLSASFYLGTFVPDTSYETGGDTITNPASPNLALPSRIDFMAISNSTGGGYTAQYVPSTGKVKIFKGEAEVAATTDLSAQIFTFFCIGAT